jgi:predicted RNase H-like HicB family nuclease
MKKTFLVVYEKGRKNYGGFAPDVPGCISLGGTLDEIRTNLLEALQLYMDTAVELGYPVPEPTSNSVTLPIEGETDPKTTYVVERLTVNIPRAKVSKRKLHKVRQTVTAKRPVMQAA